MSTPVFEPRVATAPRRSPAAAPLPPLPETKPRRRAELHLFTYIVGNALFWITWAAIAISTDHWYWWPVVPMAGWAVVLGLHLAYATRAGRHAR
jgi:2TM domain-containing protein